MEELKNIPCPKVWFYKKNAKRQKIEADFTTWWLWELHDRWFWKKKWSDASQDRKPYDCNIATTSWDYYCEIKVIEKDEFHFWMFRPNQIKALEDLTKLWRKAIVVIYSIEANNYLVFLYKDLKKLYK